MLSCCDYESLNRELKLQKRAARVILSADRDSPSVQLFNKLKWIPFNEENKISSCSVVFKHIQGYLTQLFNQPFYY